MEDENKSSRMRGWNGCTHKEGKLREIDNREGGGGEGAVVVEGTTRVPGIQEWALILPAGPPWALDRSGGAVN